MYTPHRSIVYHDYNHGPDTAVTSSWSRRGEELQVLRDDRMGLAKWRGRSEGERDKIIARSVAHRSFFLLRYFYTSPSALGVG